MVTKIKPRRIKSDNPWSLWDFLGYQDETIFQWWQWWGWQVYTAWDWIAIITKDYSAMQWPAPTGFHIPLDTEFSSLLEILTTNFGLTQWSTTMETYLKMPMAGHRAFSNGDVGYGRWNYWTASCFRNTWWWPIAWDSVYSMTTHPSWYGYSLRCFKNIPIVPKSSRITLFDGSSIATNAWIFWDNINWLISISWDGENWITIMDKNLWATSTDVTSGDSFGYYYQWGNNYGFPTFWAVTTSSVKVDVNEYWPWNYYSSDIFITTEERYIELNKNLWWGETWVVTLNNAITNTWVLSVNWQTWDVTIPATEESNTKTFYITNVWDSQAAINEAQSILDWYLDWKNPIINWNDCIWIMTESRLTGTPKQLYFKRNKPQFSNNSLGYGTSLLTDELCINFLDNTVQKTIHFNWNKYVDFLETHTDYVTPYEPLYPGSPATKKYVDDKTPIVSATTPSNPIEWMLWYDTTNDVLKTYDWVNWNDIGITYSAGTWINIDANNEITNTWVLSVNSNTWAINLKTINNTSIIWIGDIATPITTVEDNLTSTSATNALSANQWRILDWKIADLMALWKFLSLWNAATGQPISFPYTTPYAYSTWDYFLVEVVDVTANYRPDWSSYTWIASSTVETDELEQGDVYIYDWSVWLLQSNHWKTASFANITGQPTDNINLATALGQKQDNLTAWTWISISSNTVTNTWVTSFNWSTWAVTYTAPVTSVNGQTGVVTIPEALIYVHTWGISQGDNITSIITALTNWKTVVIEESGLYYLVTYWDDTSYEIEASTLGWIWQALFLSITYDNSGICQSISIWNRELGWIQNDTTWTTTTVTKIWAWTEAEYNSLQTHSADIIYHIY